MIKGLALFLAACAGAMATTRITMVRNDQVVVYEEILHPAENESGSEGFPSVTVFLSTGPVQLLDEAGKPRIVTMHAGEVLYRPARAWKLYAAANTEVHFARVEFRGAGSTATWGRRGVAAGDAVPLENSFARVLDIHVAPRTPVTSGSDHDRVVVCLSGAGRGSQAERETTLRTSEIVWRPGGTATAGPPTEHPLWLVVIEPK